MTTPEELLLNKPVEQIGKQRAIRYFTKPPGHTEVTRIQAEPHPDRGTVGMALLRRDRMDKLSSMRTWWNVYALVQAEFRWRPAWTIPREASFKGYGNGEVSWRVKNTAHGDGLASAQAVTLTPKEDDAFGDMWLGRSFFGEDLNQEEAEEELLKWIATVDACTAI